jgi:hypothetical protein
MQKKTTFEVFGEDSPTSLIVTDDQYRDSATRQQGYTQGVNDLRITNKINYQTTKVTTSFMEWVAKYANTTLNDSIEVEDLMQTVSTAVKNVADTGNSQQQQIADVPETLLNSRVRNLILSGRTRDGLPAFLVPGYGEFLDMEHELNYLVGAEDTVRASTYYGANNNPSVPLANQTTIQIANGWFTTAGVTEGDLYISLKTPRRFGSMEITWCSMEYTPTQLQLYGYEDEGSQELLYEDLKHKPTSADQTANNNKVWSRTYWFTDNTKTYSNYKIHIANPYVTTLTYVGGLFSLRFFETPVADVHKFDFALMASPEEPFKVSIAKGLEGDQLLSLTDNVVVDGHLLYEMSRNYINIVPANEDTTIPDYVAHERNVYIPSVNAYIVVTTQKIQSCVSEEVLKRQCLANLQSSATAPIDYLAADTKNLMSTGGLRHRIIANSVSAEPSEKPRGAPSSFAFLVGTSYIYTPTALTATFKDATSKAYPCMDDWTIEIDCKYGGPAAEASDDYQVIFDSGYYNSLGFTFAYYHRRGQIALHVNGVWAFAVPYVFDTNWHSISVSHSNQKLFVHVDGVCLGMYDQPIILKSYYDQWMLGKWLYSNSNYWRGYLNNFKYILGSCLHQSENYQVEPVFDTTPIPDKTRWYDPKEYVVKTWDKTTKSWIKTPMITIGHIDTGYKEHLHTEQPRGTARNIEIPAVVVGSWSTNSQYDATNHSLKQLFNFSEGGGYGYSTASTTANNATTVECSFVTEREMAFEELRLICTTSAWTSDPAVFKLEQSVNADGSDAVVTLDKSVFERTGSISMAVTHPSGSVHYIHGMKRFKIVDNGRYIFHKLVFPAKDNYTDPFFVSYLKSQYLHVRLQLILRNARPEIQKCTSCVIGDTFYYGPIKLALGTTHYVPAPFGGFNFIADGFVMEQNDYERKYRKLGQQNGYYSSSHNYGGEALFMMEDRVAIVTGNVWISFPQRAGYHNTNVVNTDSPSGEAILICKRVF